MRGRALQSAAKMHHYVVAIIVSTTFPQTLHHRIVACSRKCHEVSNVVSTTLAQNCAGCERRRATLYCSSKYYVDGTNSSTLVVLVIPQNPPTVVSYKNQCYVVRYMAELGTAILQ